MAPLVVPTANVSARPLPARLAVIETTKLTRPDGGVEEVRVELAERESVTEGVGTPLDDREEVGLGEDDVD